MIAYYAHSHGSGHLASSQLFVDHLYSDTLIITAKRDSIPSRYKVLTIENEDTTPAEYQPALSNLPVYAHFLPKSNKKILRRNKQIIDALLANNISLMCVDVSVETAILCRICSIPYGYYLLPGDRSDKAHTTTFDAAEFLYTFLPKQLFVNFEYESYDEKTFFLGFYSQYTYTDEFRINESVPLVDGKRILIICGNGGTNFTADLIREVITALPMCTVKVIGNIDKAAEVLQDRYLGVVDTVEPYIKEADVVISSCGVNLTSEILALKNKFIVFPETRPYQEQKMIAEALIKNKLAILFDLSHMQNCIMEYLKLNPPEELSEWFCNPDQLTNLKDKIQRYEN